MHLGPDLDKGPEKLRANARKAWYKNLEQVMANGDDLSAEASR